MGSFPSHLPPLSLAEDSLSVRSSCSPPGDSYSWADLKTAVTLAPAHVWQRAWQRALASSSLVPHLSVFSGLGKDGGNEKGRESIQTQLGHPQNKGNKAFKHPSPESGQQSRLPKKNPPTAAFPVLKIQRLLRGEVASAKAPAFPFYLNRFSSGQAHSPPTSELLTPSPREPGRGPDQAPKPQITTWTQSWDGEGVSEDPQADSARGPPLPAQRLALHTQRLPKKKGGKGAGDWSKHIGKHRPRAGTPTRVGGTPAGPRQRDFPVVPGRPTGTPRPWGQSLARSPGNLSRWSV